jgi:hypothetical protein
MNNESMGHFFFTKAHDKTIKFKIADDGAKRAFQRATIEDYLAYHTH